MADPQISGGLAARLVLRVVEACRKRGHDAEALCRKAGVSWAALNEPDARIAYATAERLGMGALELTGDANFGLHLAQDVGDTRHFDSGLLLLMASPTVRAALERMVANQRYWGDGARSELVPVPGGTAVRYVLAGSRGDYARHSDECAMAEIALGVRSLSGLPLRARCVRFRHAAPPDIAEHRKVFECELSFRDDHTEIEFDDAALNARMLHANASFCAIFEDQVQRAIERLPPPAAASEHVRSAVRAALAGGACTLNGTAEALGISSRTLQRRLKEEGTSFAAIVDSLRQELAMAYLERSLPISEIASLLGYSDGTAFHHAFVRWTGSSPSRYSGG